MDRLQSKNIMLGISGGIAAYKSAELTRKLISYGSKVKIVMSHTAAKFVTPTTMQALSGCPVHIDLFDSTIPNTMGHIELAKWADLILIVPGTADIIARIAQGCANDLLTTLVLATQAKVAIAPSMNQAMWSNLATQYNVSTLKSRGINILGPSSGRQACGDLGIGRMLEVEEIINCVVGVLGKGHLNGRHILISAGPTYEGIDPVRFLTNHSSGKMGFSIAQAAVEAGADVTLVAGPVSLDTPNCVKRINIVNALEMLMECQKISNSCDVFIACAAVSDYRPEIFHEQKMKKIGSTTEPLYLKMTPNPDILANISFQKNRPFCVGFAAETENVLNHAIEKLKKKKLDLIVANDVSQPDIGFNSEENIFSIIDKDLSITNFDKQTKIQLARKLIHFIKKRMT